jgi:hypothetical protein
MEVGREIWERWHLMATMQPDNVIVEEVNRIRVKIKPRHFFLPVLPVRIDWPNISQ